jgi:deoxyribodipyrimidine photo-lyase
MKLNLNYWCNGQTGYPIVDAGMRELNATGFMHNRDTYDYSKFLRSYSLIGVGAKLICKKLLDYDFAANNGGWQWLQVVVNADPYFRVFNPTLQTASSINNCNTSVNGNEFEGFNYAKPIVKHEDARKRVLEVYAKR